MEPTGDCVATPSFSTATASCFFLSCFSHRIERRLVVFLVVNIYMYDVCVCVRKILVVCDLMELYDEGKKWYALFMV